MPQMFLSGPPGHAADLYCLKNYILGFSARQEGLVEYNSITGFTEYVAAHFHETGHHDWATIIHLYTPEDKAFEVFYDLYDRYMLYPNFAT